MKAHTVRSWCGIKSWLATLFLRNMEQARSEMVQHLQSSPLLCCQLNILLLQKEKKKREQHITFSNK